MALHYREQLGAAIRHRRKALGMSQKDLATAAHIQESQTVSRWERGENIPGDLEAVAEALETTVAELMTGIRPPRRAARKLNLGPSEPEEQPSLADVMRELAEIRRELRDIKRDGEPGRNAA